MNIEKPKILVINDEDDLRELVQIALSDDFSVLTVDDEREAVTKLSEFQPQLIVTDLLAGSFGNFELFAEIRKISRAAIIVVSEKNRQHEQTELSGLGVSRVMIRPFSLKELRNEVQSALRSESD